MRPRSITVALSTVPVPAARHVTPTGHVTALVVSAYAADSVGTPQSLLYLAFRSLKLLPGVRRIILLYRLLVTIVLRALLEG